MNAPNSQGEELENSSKRLPGRKPPVRFARYTGQEKGEEREAIRSNPPDILLTNYMMLELLLTRNEDRELVRAAQRLRFLVFDEMHSYRGRQGADVGLLIRRCRLAFGGHDIICIGTSATMASEGTSIDQKREVAKVAQMLFGVSFDANQIIGETLERATPEVDFQDPKVIQALREAIEADAPPPESYEPFHIHPLPHGSSLLSESKPRREAAVSCAAPADCRAKAAWQRSFQSDVHRSSTLRRHIAPFLIQGSGLRRSESSRFLIFAFRLHQFFTRGDTVWSTIEPEADRHLEMSKGL
jgi:hypothetical protein